MSSPEFVDVAFSISSDTCVQNDSSSSPSGQQQVSQLSPQVARPSNSVTAMCPAAWDELLCWFPVEAGKVARVSCQAMFQAIGTEVPRDELFQNAFITRTCDSNGSWVNRTNYDECLPFFPSHDENPSMVPMFVSLTLFIGSSISLVLLLASLFIFFYFPSLECTRIRVHRNLMVALLVHSVLLVIMIGPVVLGLQNLNFKQIDIVCKGVLILKLYASMASINWMFVEGLLLHTKLSGVFVKETPFILYYFIGWGIPSLVIICWSSIMTWTLDSHCWEGYSDSPFVWMVIVPQTLALIANSIFLVNIIRILILKIKDTVSVEMQKALKATALLFPLLGMDHLFFCVNPKNDNQLEDAYVIINAIVQALQGTLVSILYCFINTQVRETIKSSYMRHVMQQSIQRDRNETNFKRIETQL